MLQIFIGAATHHKHNKEDQYLNFKACLLIFQAHMISRQAQNEAFNKWRHFRGKNSLIWKYSPCTFQVTRQYAWLLCVSTPARQSQGSAGVSCTTAANMRSAYWEQADEDKRRKTSGRHATSSYVWAWHFPSLPHISCIKDEENEAAQADARDSRENIPSFPVFALLWAKAPIIGAAGGITCLLALLLLPQPCDKRRIDEDTLGWIN